MFLAAAVLLLLYQLSTLICIQLSTCFSGFLFNFLCRYFTLQSLCYDDDKALFVCVTEQKTVAWLKKINLNDNNRGWMEMLSFDEVL